MVELAGRILTPEGFIQGRIGFEERIRYLEPAPVEGPWILPGFIDLHVHGGGGVDVMEGEEALRRLARFLAQHGTTAFLPTTVTAPPEEIERALKGVGAVVQDPEPQGALPLGAHLEGPFLSPHRLGAQPPYPLPPDLRLMEAWARLAPIRVVTLAPELPGSLELIAWLRARGIRPQQGHTAANYAEALAAFEAGAQGFTHFCNAMTPLHHREPGVVGLGLERGEWAEAIPDGLHLHPAVLRALLRGIPSLYFVSDAVAAAGMPEGEYRLGRRRVWRRGEGVYLEDGGLAGSALTLDRALRRLVAWGVSLEEAARRLSTLPARYLGLRDRGRLEVGCVADILVLDPGLRLQAVYLGGVPLETVSTPPTGG